MLAENRLVDGEGALTRSYRRRWVIIAVTVMFNVSLGFGKAYFGQVNDVYGEYFQVSLSTMDWLTVASAASAILACVVIAFIVSSSSVGLRGWCLAQCGIIAVSYTLLAASCLKRNFFPMALIAQFLTGISLAIGMVTTPLIAVTWFPPEEIGIAMGIHFAGLSVGFSFGFFVPSRLLKTAEEGGEDIELMLEVTQMRSIYLFASISAFLFLLFAITYFVLLNQPLIAPSKSELEKRMSRRKNADKANNTIIGKDFRNFTPFIRHFFKNVKLLWSDRCFSMIALSFGLAFSNDAILFALLSDVVSSRAGALTSNITAEETSGLAMTIFAIFHLFGGVLAGKLIDCTTRYKVLACTFYFIDFLASLTILVSIVLANTPLLYVGTSLFGLGTMAALLSAMEVACQHMFPTNELFISAWLITSGQTLGLILPLMFRLILNHYGYLLTVSLQSSLLAIGMIVLLLTRPRYRRLRMNSLKPGEKPHISEMVEMEVSPN